MLSEGQTALDRYDLLLQRYGDSSGQYQAEFVAKALINKSAMLNLMGRTDEALKTVDQVVSQFGGEMAFPLQERVAKALINKGVELDWLGRYDEGLLAYEAVVARFGAAAETGLQERVARALVYMGDSIDELDRNEEALKAYDAVASRFGAATEPALRAWLAIARNNKGCSLIRQARENWLDKDWRLERLVEAQQCFTDAQADCGKEQALVLANQAYVRRLLDEQAHPYPHPLERPRFARWRYQPLTQP